MSYHDAIAISVEQLLELRHVPTPSTRTLPESNSAWLGMFRSRKRGQGTDYDDLRPYSAGDDIRHIDWRASARTGDLHTRLYREEKEHRLTIVCDLRHCMFTGSQRLRATRAIILCARLLWHACQGGTRVYLSILTQTGVCSIAPGSGHTLAIRACAALSHQYNKALQIIRAHQTHRRQKQKKFTTPFSDPETTTENAVLQTNTDATDPYSEQNTLPSEHPVQGPTLASLLEWLIAQNEHKATLLWISGLDFEGDQFYELLDIQKERGAQLMIHMDDPLLDNAFRAGVYDYDSYTIQTEVPRRAMINQRQLRTLQKHLMGIKNTRISNFDSLGIPLISNALGDDAVIAQLRQQAYIA